MLERQMQEMRDLPDRVAGLESQIVQLRQEMRDEFSATRAELRGELASKGELAQAVATLRSELASKSELAQAVATLRGELASKGELAQAVATLRNELASKGELAQAVTTLRGEIAGAVTTLATAITDTNTHMRMLHEEAMSRIATIGEARRRGKKR
jgi:DNA-binding winged helix-turn-helix (wHTH) protein